MIIKMAVNGYSDRLEEAHPIDGGSDRQSSQEHIEMRGRRMSWRFIDGLSNVERHDIESDSIPPADDYDHFYLSVSEYVKDAGNGYGRVSHTSNACRVWIEATQSASGDKSLNVCIVSDMEVYLLNDSGKTIERLN